MSQRVRLTGEPARELKTFRIAGVLKDETGAAVPAASLSTLKLTLFNAVDGAIINAVAAVNILNADRGTVDVNGNMICTLAPTDSPILGAGANEEKHVAFFEWTYAGGSKAGGVECEFLVCNFVKLP